MKLIKAIRDGEIKPYMDMTIFFHNPLDEETIQKISEHCSDIEFSDIEISKEKTYLYIGEMEAYFGWEEGKDYEYEQKIANFLQDLWNDFGIKKIDFSCRIELSGVRL